MNLGNLIRALEHFKPDAEVRFDFCYTTPTTLASYRGDYAQLALGWKDIGYRGESGASFIKVEALLKELRGAIGKDFTGWKGGDYTMDERTEVWVANQGDAGGTEIYGVQARYDEPTLLTRCTDVEGVVLGQEPQS